MTDVQNLHVHVTDDCGFVPQVSKLGQLKELLTPFEYEHIEVFPSILRILPDLMYYFWKNPSVTFDTIYVHRVLDNATISLTWEGFWLHLKYDRL